MSKTVNPTIIDETASLYDNLEDFGLSSYEARVFYAMLKIGFSDARTISRKSDVPFGRIYDVLGSLEDMDLIEKQDSRPKKYAVKEPKFALNNLLLRKRKELDSLTSRAKTLENELAKVYRKKPEEGLFWSVAVDPNSIGRHLGKIVEAEVELLMYIDVQINVVKDTRSTEGIIDFLGMFRELITKGVNIRILLGGVTDKAQLNQFTKMFVDYPVLSHVPVRVTSVASNSFDVIDSEKVLLKISNPVNSSEYFAAIYVWHKKFATELQKRFNQMWDEAEESFLEIPGS